MTALCEVCGAGFEPRRWKANRYCGMPCYRAAQKAGAYIGTRVRKVPCHTCGKDHAPTRSKKRDGSPADHQFCSRACYLKRHSRRVDWACAGCGKAEQMTPYHAKRRKYCSHGCRVVSKRPEPINCRVCEVFFTPIQIRPKTGYVVFKKDRTTCSTECFSRWASEDEERKRKIGDAFTGERHPNWMGGRSAIRHNHRGRGWARIARKVRRRDGYRCTECGKSQKEEGARLCVHHIVPYHNFKTAREANRMSNLRSLCRSCHTRIEHQVPVQQMVIPLAFTS